MKKQYIRTVVGILEPFKRVTAQLWDCDGREMAWVLNEGVWVLSEDVFCQKLQP